MVRHDTKIEAPFAGHDLTIVYFMRTANRPASRNPRSTVGTITEVYDYLRLLHARVGIQHKSPVAVRPP